MTANESDNVTVYIVDDDEAVLKGLRLLVKSIGVNVETFASAEDFLTAFDPYRPGCLVLDVRMRGMSGLQLQEVLAERGASLPIIFITGHGDIPMAVGAMKHGAVDFIEKPFRDQVLLDRINDALRKDGDERRELSEIREIHQRLDSLTAKEREALELIVAGKPNKEIASSLGVTTKAIEARRAKLMSKMQAETAADLVRMAVRAGVGTDPPRSIT